MEEYIVKVFEDRTEWYQDGQLHRLDGPAIEDIGGSKEWRVEGELHRLDGPAIERSSGTKGWYVEGKRHRLDGPAIEYASGCKEWWIKDQRYTEEEFNNLNQSCDGKTVEIDGQKYLLKKV